jgi:hypothetical protein
MIYQFWIIFAILFFSILIFDKKYCMLRDISKSAGHQPYSWSRVQLAWWTVIVLTSFITIILVEKGIAPTLNSSTVILLGISAATTATARVIDISDKEKFNRTHQDDFGKNFFIDILSDQNGVSVHRFQTIVFNAVFGIWFIGEVLVHLKPEILQANIDLIMPPISNNNLILLGLSSATYAALKMTENRSAELTTKNKTTDTEDAAEVEGDGSVG